MSKQLLNKLALAHKSIPINATFSHYKGGNYKVTDLVINETTQSVMVVYIPMHGVFIKYTRPIEEWYQMCSYTIPADKWNGPGETVTSSPRFKLYHKYD